MVRCEPEHGLERDVPVEAPIVSEDKLVEVGVDVLAAQPVIGQEHIVEAAIKGRGNSDLKILAVTLLTGEEAYPVVPGCSTFSV